ncbi:OLC1v1002230C1 [Oldenlandia corymbosa var. corymbosa]|nr:OLC1v1002230C1 [Oldenlandia corymbosa var. corymbosa]
MSWFSGENDPFDHPFFTQPLKSFFGERNPFDDPFFSRPFDDQLGSRKPITVEELNLDDGGTENSNAGREIISNKPSRNANGNTCYTFRGFAYGGPEGWQYSCSESGMAGGDGVFLAEMKEDNRMVGESLHTISKGIRNKGHSVTKKKKSDGSVDSLQTLHNLNEDELTGFEENWNTSASKYLPSWSTNFNPFENGGANWIGWEGFPAWNNWGGYALPPAENYGETGAGEPDGRRRGKKVVRVNIE